MENLDFWLAAGGMTLGVAGLLVLSARSGSRIGAAQADDQSDQRRDLQVYRDQLRDVERDLARGSLAAPEAERLRVEIARRLLEADRQANAQRRPQRRKGGLWLAAGAVVLAGAAAVWTYERIGLPGYPDMPLQARLAQADQLMALRPSQSDYLRNLKPLPPAEPDGAYLELLGKLRAAVDPATATDLQGLELLARNEATIGNFAAAIAAQSRLIAVKAASASAADQGMLAEMLIRQTQGYVSPQAEAALIAALKLDPQDGLARYYTGLMFAQGGRYDRAFSLWRPLLEQSPADAPWLAPLRGQITEVAALAGVTYTPPEAAAGGAAEALAGPSAEAVEAAAALSGDERSAMVEGMVAQLTTRLGEQGGTAAEWAQLIRALGVLGRGDQARSIAAEAAGIFAASPADLAQITAAATAAGVQP